MFLSRLRRRGALAGERRATQHAESSYVCRREKCGAQARIGIATGFAMFSVAFYLQLAATIAIVVAAASWMTAVAVRMIRLPHRNGWQLAWLILAGILTVYPGSIAVVSIFVLVYASLAGIENESVGYATLGALLASALWLIPIVGTYLLGVSVVQIRARARKR